MRPQLIGSAQSTSVTLALLLLLWAAPGGAGRQTGRELPHRGSGDPRHRLALAQVQDAQWVISADQRTVTVTTATLTATWSDGTLVALTNRTGGDSLFVPAPESAAPPALTDETGLSVAGDQTAVTCERTGDGVEVRLRGLAGAPSGATELLIGAGPDGDLLVRQHARRDAPRLLSASWGVAGLDASRTQVVVPAGGGMVLDGLRGPGARQLAWPGNWQAALLILQGARGGFAVWAEDPEAQFKSAELLRLGGELTLRFGSESRAHLDEAREVVSPVWHIKAYDGDWKVAALAYRAVMGPTLGLTALAERQPAWVRDIRCVVRVSNEVTLDDLRGLAQQLDPRQTLLYVPGWRKLPYDVLYPDYEPREGFVEWCRGAQALGFRVMPHGNLVGIGPQSPELPEVEQFIQRDRLSGAPVGWYLDRPDDPGRIYCLNPAAAQVRQFLISHFRRAWEEVRFDALHLDFPVIISPHEGDLEGMTCARGALEYLRELQAALPDVALSTEGLNEALLACSFAQLGEPFWVNPGPGETMHPVRSLLFAPYCGLYGHLGLPSQATSFPGFLGHHDFFDRLGAWPTMSLDGPFDPQNPGDEFVLREVRFFQQQRLSPAPEEVRFPEELFAWRGADGQIVATFDTPPGRRLAPRAAPDEAVWVLLSRVNTYDGPGYVADWRAFAGQHLFGLDPESRYPIVPAAPRPDVLHLTSASGPIVLNEVRDGVRRALFRLAGHQALVADLVEQASSAAAGIIVGGQQQPVSAGAQFATGAGASGGIALPSLLAHPPWRGAALGGLTYGEFPIEVPEHGRTLLRFAIGLGDLTGPEEAARDREQPLSDGVTFTVSVDGESVFEELATRGAWAWREVDLTPYAGRAVVLRLSTGPGPQNNVGWDWALWGQPRVVNTGQEVVERPLRLQAFAPRGEGLPCFGDPDRPGRVVSSDAAEGGRLIEVELPRPQAFGFLYDVTPAAAGLELADLPFTNGSSADGVLVEGSIYGSGSVGPQATRGETRRAISGHPPALGRTVLDWCLQLPADPLRLRFGCAVLDGGGPVAFEVQVNGAPVWSLPMPYPDGWKEGLVDLSPYVGRPVLLSLVTDSVGTNNCDWAQWGDARLEAP